MRAYIPWVGGLIVGIAAGWLLFSGGGDEGLQKRLDTAESSWQSERDQLEQALRAAREKPPRIQTIYKDPPESYTNHLSPQEILAQLVKINPADYDSRNLAFRRIIYYFESLADAGDYALPVIREFLLQNIDVDYSQTDLKPSGESAGRGAFGSRNMVRTDFLVPPSLRLGLFSSLERMGQPEAEQLLSEMLNSTARGVEVAYLARILQDMRPDHYRDAAVMAARELLTNPPDFENPNRLDENSRAYLYQVLTSFSDTGFAETAQTMIVTKDGRVDRLALNYVSDVLGDFSMEAMLAAYRDTRLSNRWDRTHLLTSALPYVGPNAFANEMFSSMLADEDLPIGVRSYTLKRLSGGSNDVAPTDPSQIKARMQFLDVLRARSTDERILLAIDQTAKALETILHGGAPTTAPAATP